MTTHINLLPMAYRRKQTIRRTVRQWIVIWVVAAILMGAFAWNQWTQFQSGEVRLIALRQEIEPIQTIQEETKDLDMRIQQLRQREKLVLSLADEQSMLTLVGMLSQAARDCDGCVSIQSLDLRNTQNQETAVRKVMTLRGVATDDASIAKFADALRDFDAFQRVQLMNTGAAAIKNGARTYLIECSF